eukprot:579968-Amphidinium_carterae.2
MVPTNATCRSGAQSCGSWQDVGRKHAKAVIVAGWTFSWLCPGLSRAIQGNRQAAGCLKTTQICWVPCLQNTRFPTSSLAGEV